MRSVFRVVLVGACCVAVALGVIAWITGLDWRGAVLPGISSVPGNTADSTQVADTGLETFPDSNAPGTSARVYVDRSFFDGDIFDTALPFTGRDPRPELAA